MTDKVYCNECRYFDSGCTKFGKFEERCLAKLEVKKSYKKIRYFCTPRTKNQHNDCLDFKKKRTLFQWLIFFITGEENV